MSKPTPRDVQWLVEDIIGLKSDVKNLKNRKPGLAYSSIEDGAIREFDKDGVQGSQIGKQPDGTHGSVVLNGPKPPKPTPAVVTANPGQGEARWNGKFVGDVVSPLDLKHVAAYFVLAGEFLDLSKQAGVMTGELGDNVQAQLVPGVYSVYLVSWSLAGRYSDASDPVTLLVPDAVDTDWIQGAIDDLDERFDGVITEAGTLGDRLTQAETDLELAGDLLADTDARLDEVFGEVSAIPDAITAAKQAAISAAASDAQSKADAALATANAAVAALASNAGNMAGYGDLESMSGTYYPLNSSEARSGSRAFTVAIDAGNQYGNNLPDISVDGGGWYRVAFWIKATADFTSQAGMPCMLVDANGTQINNIPYYPSLYRSADRGPLAPNVWKQVSALWQIPAEHNGVAITKMRPRFYVWQNPAAAGVTVRMDDFTVQDVSAAKGALDAAEAARLAAVAAQAKAGTAEATANNALTMAGSATKAYYSTNPPSGVARTDRDIWRQINSTKDVIGEWFWDATLSTPGWVKTLISSQSISNLDVGKLTVGTGIISDLVAEHIAGRSARFIQLDVSQLVAVTGTMSEAVINKLFTDVVMSRKITTQMLAVGDFENYIATGLGANNESYDWALGLTPDFADVPSGLSHSFKSTVGQGTKNSTASSFDANPGDEFIFEVWVKADKPGSRIFIEMRDQAGAHGVTSTRFEEDDLFWGNDSYPVSSAPVPTSWTKWRAKCVVKSGVRSLRIASIYFNHTAGTERNAQVWLAGLSFKRRFGGEAVIDGSLKSRSIDVEDLAANTGFIADLTARIVKSDMFVGKEFIGGVFTGGTFQTSILPNVGVKFDGNGFRAYGPDGGEPIVEMSSTGVNAFGITNPESGESVVTFDNEGGAAVQSLAVADEARMDGPVVTGGDPLTSGHGSGLYGVTMNGRDLLGATFANYVQAHPDVADGNAWMTVIPHGVIGQQEVSTPGQVWNATGGIDHARIRAAVTIDAVWGRMYQITYRTPAIRETSVVGGTIGGVAIVHSPKDGVISAGSSTNKALQGSRYYLRGGDGFDQAIVTTYARCPEDIPEGKIMLGPELYIYSGRAAVASGTADTSRWSVTVADLGLRRASYSGKDIDSSKQGTANPPAPAPQPPPIREYVSTENHSWHRNFNQNGTPYSSSKLDSKAVQGRSPYYTTGGAKKSMIGFPSFASFASGATVTKVEVYVYAETWHAATGGTLVMGYHGAGSAPGSFAETTADIKRQAMKRGEGRWITLPSSVHAAVKSGSFRGITLRAPADSTSTTYYGYVDPTKKDKRARIRVTVLK